MIEESTKVCWMDSRDQGEARSSGRRGFGGSGPADKWTRLNRRSRSHETKLGGNSLTLGAGANLKNDSDVEAQIAAWIEVKYSYSEVKCVSRNLPSL